MYVFEDPKKSQLAPPEGAKTKKGSFSLPAELFSFPLGKLKTTGQDISALGCTVRRPSVWPLRTAAVLQHNGERRSLARQRLNLPRNTTPPLHTDRTGAPQYHSTPSPVREAAEDGENGSGAKTWVAEAGGCSSDMIDFLDDLPRQVPQQLTIITRARELCRVNP